MRIKSKGNRKYRYRVKCGLSYLHTIFVLSSSKNTKLVLFSPIQFNKGQEIQTASCVLGIRLWNNDFIVHLQELTENRQCKI